MIYSVINPVVFITIKRMVLKEQEESLEMEKLLYHCTGDYFLIPHNKLQ